MSVIIDIDDDGRVEATHNSGETLWTVEVPDGFVHPSARDCTDVTVAEFVRSVLESEVDQHAGLFAAEYELLEFIEKQRDELLDDLNEVDPNTLSGVELMDYHARQSELRLMDDIIRSYRGDER